MGFFDSFSSAVGSFFGSPIGTALGQIGVAKLTDVIGLRPTGASGSPRAGGPGTTFQPLGSPRQPGAFGGGFPSLSQQQEQARRAQEERLFFQPGGPGNPVRAALGPGAGLRPQLAAPPPSIPASQPFGVSPGTQFATFGGGMPAFPNTVQASFPPNPFIGGNPFFQQAGFASAGSALLRQVPGLLGGLAAGELFGGGGGGDGTPPFRATMAGARAQFFRTQNPATGQDTWFRPAGRPLLWSGDLTACNRVKKVARKAARKR